MRLLEPWLRRRPMRFPEPPRRPRPDHWFVPLFLTLLCTWFAIV
ncbi:hypothetical protein [Alicyclobacillus sp.]|nr:hypothetical protein [Alicyclobacillus sp.]